MAVLAFNRWSTEGITIVDPGLQNYICLEPKIVPRTGARHAKFRFHKSKVSIVERLINRLMVTGHKSKKHFISSGHNTGKAAKSYDLAIKTFELVEHRTKKNPLMVFVKAIETAAPRDEIVSIEYEIHSSLIGGRPVGNEHEGYLLALKEIKNLGVNYDHFHIGVSGKHEHGHGGGETYLIHFMLIPHEQELQYGLECS